MVVLKAPGCTLFLPHCRRKRGLLTASRPSFAPAPLSGSSAPQFRVKPNPPGPVLSKPVCKGHKPPDRTLCALSCVSDRQSTMDVFKSRLLGISVAVAHGVFSGSLNILLKFLISNYHFNFLTLIQLLTSSTAALTLETLRRLGKIQIPAFSVQLSKVKN